MRSPNHPMAGVLRCRPFACERFLEYRLRLAELYGSLHSVALPLRHATVPPDVLECEAQHRAREVNQMRVISRPEAAHAKATSSAGTCVYCDRPAMVDSELDLTERSLGTIGESCSVVEVDGPMSDRAFESTVGYVRRHSEWFLDERARCTEATTQENENVQ